VLKIDFEALLLPLALAEVDIPRRIFPELFKVFDMKRIDLQRLNLTVKEYIVDNFFTEREKMTYYNKGNNHYFIETITRHIGELQ